MIASIRRDGTPYYRPGGGICLPSEGMPLPGVVRNRWEVMFRHSEEQAALRREFLTSLAKTERTRTLLASAAAVVFWLFFTYLDFEIYPESIPALFPLRVAVLLVFLITFAITLKTPSYEWAIGSAAVAWTCATGAIAIMCRRKKGGDPGGGT